MTNKSKLRVDIVTPRHRCTGNGIELLGALKRLGEIAESAPPTFASLSTPLESLIKAFPLNLPLEIAFIGVINV
jgi:hypothetical protein